MTTFANRYVGISREATYGSLTSIGTEKIGEVDDESIVHSFDIMDRGDVSYWGMTKSQNGKEYSEGDLNLVLQADDFCGLLLYGAMGTDAITGSNPYTHVMTETVANTLPSFRIRVGRQDLMHTYQGMCVNRLSLSASLGEYVTMSVGFMGKAESALAALTGSPTFDGKAVDGMHFVDASVKFDTDTTASTMVKSFSMELNNNLDGDAACAIGSNTYVRQPPMQRREVTGTIEFNQPILNSDPLPAGQESEPTYAELIASGGLEVKPAAAVTSYALRFTLSDGTHTTQLDLFDVRYEAPSGVNVSGRDTTTMSLNYRAYVRIMGANPSNHMLEVTHMTASANQVYTGM